MSLPLIIKDIEDRFKISGGTLTGNVEINKSSYPMIMIKDSGQGRRGEFIYNINEEVIISNYKDENNRSLLFLRNENNINNSLQLSRVVDGQWSSYNIYGEHNKPTANDVGALSLAGGTLSGDTIYLADGYSKFYGDSLEACFITYDTPKDINNSRNIELFNHNTFADTKNAFYLIDIKDGQAYRYKIYGEHNKPTAKDVEALAWCSNEDVNASPSILAVVNSMNTGGSFFAVQGSSIINASDSPIVGAEFHYFVLMDTQFRKRVIAHHYNDGGFNIYTRRIFNDAWLDGAWVNLGQAFSNADTVDGYHGWEFARTAFTTTNDLNHLTFSGMYRINGGSGININAPGEIDYGQVLVVRGGGDTIAQVGFDYGASRAFLRTGNPPECNGAGAWRPWYQFYTTGSITKGTGSAPSLTENYIYLQYV